MLLTTILLSLLWGCDHQANKDKIEKNAKSESSSSDSKENEWKYREAKRNDIDSLMLDICSTQNIEIIDLYPILDSISPFNYENLYAIDTNLILVNSLRKRGFKVTNWNCTPRLTGDIIVVFHMSNEDCECQVDKLFYKTKQEGRFKVTERIKCKKANR